MKASLSRETFPVVVYSGGKTRSLQVESEGAATIDSVTNRILLLRGGILVESSLHITSSIYGNRSYNP